MKAHIHEVTSDKLESFIQQHAIVFMDFWAEWCAPCKAFASVFESVANQFPDIVFAKVNIQNESELAETFQIRSIPHLMVFKNGVAIYSDAGSMPESILKELIAQAKEAEV